jgi:tRNA(Ile)-lysidine synthase
MLAEIAEQHKYSAVVTGHTASDRAETLLYNLLRGSGMDGLQALTWKRSLSHGVQLVRPLLEFARGETAQFCQERDLQVWEDSTNQDLGYARNRIRQELLPYLQAHFNPQVESTLAQTAELLQAEVEYLETVARELLQQAQLPQQTGRTGQPGLNQRVLQSAPLALQRRVVRLFLQQALPSMPSFQDIEKLTNLIPAPNRSQTDPFPGGEIARVEGDWIWMTELEGEKRGGREGGGDRETGRWGE